MPAPQPAPTQSSPKSGIETNQLDLDLANLMDVETALVTANAAIASPVGGESSESFFSSEELPELRLESAPRTPAIDVLERPSIPSVCPCCQQEVGANDAVFHAHVQECFIKARTDGYDLEDDEDICQKGPPREGTETIACIERIRGCVSGLEVRRRIDLVEAMVRLASVAASPASGSTSPSPLECETLALLFSSNVRQSPQHKAFEPRVSSPVLEPEGFRVLPASRAHPSVNVQVSLSHVPSSFHQAGTQAAAEVTTPTLISDKSVPGVSPYRVMVARVPKRKLECAHALDYAARDSNVRHRVA